MTGHLRIKERAFRVWRTPFIKDKSIWEEKAFTIKEERAFTIKEEKAFTIKEEKAFTIKEEKAFRYSQDFLPNGKGHLGIHHLGIKELTGHG